MAARHIPQRRPTSELARLVAATVERVAPAHVGRTGEDLLADAFAAANLDDIPYGPEELLFFASGPLYELVQQEWGDPIADALLLELAPVFDRAWARDRIELGGDFVPQSSTHVAAHSSVPGSSVPGSNVRRRSGVRPTVKDTVPTVEATVLANEEALATEEALANEEVLATEEALAEDIVRADTIPAAPPTTLISYIDDEDRTLTEPLPPSSRRRGTIPYTPTAFLPNDERVRVLVVAHDAATRCKFVSVLNDAACAVAMAPDAACAAALYARLEPALLIADLETIAPDFEPLRAALDGVFGDAPPASVVLLSDEPPRERHDDVVSVIAESTTPEQLAHLLDALLQERQ
jgi:hypothetical protein